MLAQKEGIQRRHRIEEFEDESVALKLLVGVVTRGAQAFLEAALVEEDGLAARAQIVLVEWDDQLGARRACRVEQECLVRPDAVFEDEAAVDDGRREERLGAMIRIFRVDARDLPEVEDAA